MAERVLEFGDTHRLIVDDTADEYRLEWYDEGAGTWKEIFKFGTGSGLNPMNIHGAINQKERQGDITPDPGEAAIWVSDGTETGSDGDIMYAQTDEAGTTSIDNLTLKGATALSELTIDTDKNWQGYKITNLGEVSVGDLKMANGWTFTEHPDFGVILESPSGEEFKMALEKIGGKSIFSKIKDKITEWIL